MIRQNDNSQQLQAQVLQAIKNQQPLNIHGGKSKHFYGNFNATLKNAIPLDVCSHSGIVDYEPTELAITVRAGTPLKMLVNVLAEQHQILPFEPPHYTENSTIGGAIAAGISGPRRAYSGSARDTILGVQIINGKGQIVSFGGQVMKNVAGYDLSRLMVRSMGTLGVILNVSLRLLPKPPHETTRVFDLSQQDALAYFQLMRKKQQLVSASAWVDGHVFLRLSGTEKGVNQVCTRLGGTSVPEGETCWHHVRDHQHEFFRHTNKQLWRLSLPPATPLIQLTDDNLLLEWGGSQRWIHSNSPNNIMHSIASKHQGYATLIRSEFEDTPRFQKPEPALLNLHKQLKHKMDPHGIFNPGRLYTEL